VARKLLIVVMSIAVFSGCTVRVVGTTRPRVVPPPPVAAQVEFAVFYDRLRPYGSWVTVEEYGQVWVPGGVGPDWRPYVDGHWLYTEDGWLWVSDYEWGWAPFHYGRWARHARYRWVWIPGSVWAPAWVAWRHGGDVVGWAPLGPRARWQNGVGLVDDDDRDVAPDAWCFVNEVDLTRPAIRVVVRPVVQNVVIIRRTTNVTRYTVVNNRVINDGVDVRHHEQTIGKAVPRYRTADRDDAGPAAVRDSEIRVYRPARPRPEPVTDERELRRRQDLERRKLEADQAVEHRETAAAREREQAEAAAAAAAQRVEANRRQDEANRRQVEEIRRQREVEARRRQEQERKAMEDRHEEEKRGMTQRQGEERDTARKKNENENENENEKGKAKARGR